MNSFWMNLKNEFKVKDKNFYKTICLGLIVIALLFVSFFSEYFVWIAFCAACLIMLLTRGIKKVYILIFLYPFYGVMRVSYSQRTFMSILVMVAFGVLLIEFLYDIFKNKKKISVKLLSLYCLFVIYLFIPFGEYSVYRSFSMLTSFGVVYFVWEYKQDLGFKELAFALTYGLLLSCLLSPLLYILPRLSDLIYKSKTQIAGFYRYSGLIEDPNYFGIKLILTITLLNVLYNGKEINYFYWVMLFTVASLGVLTVSKAFFLVFIGFLCLTMFESFFKKDWKYTLKYCIATIIIVTVSWVCFNTFVQMLFGRLASTGYGGSDKVMTNLTTGRSDLWVEYLKAWTSGFKNFMFGHGLGADFLEQVNMTAAHNVYIEMLYLVGFVGFVLFFGIILFVFISTSTKNNRKIVNFIPTICLAVLLMSLNSFNSYRAYILVILLSFAMNYVAPKDAIEKK